MTSCSATPMAAPSSRFPAFTGKKRVQYSGPHKKLGAGVPGNGSLFSTSRTTRPAIRSPPKKHSASATALVVAANAGNDIVVHDRRRPISAWCLKKGYCRSQCSVCLQNAHERILAVKLDGPTKEDYVWGFRVGFVHLRHGPGIRQRFTAHSRQSSPAPLRGNISNCSNLSQTLPPCRNAHRGYEKRESEKFAILKTPTTKKSGTSLPRTPEYRPFFAPLPFHSGYFMCIKISKAKPSKTPHRNLRHRSHCRGREHPPHPFSSTPYDLLEKLFDNVYMAAKDVAGKERFL